MRPTSTTIPDNLSILDILPLSGESLRLKRVYGQSTVPLQALNSSPSLRCPRLLAHAIVSWQNDDGAA
jgi:hypothetical protein